MANWKEKVKIGDIHEAYEAEDICIEDVCAKVATRLKETNLAKSGTFLGDMLLNYCELLGSVETDDEYDDILDRIYDIGDRDHSLWIDTFSR